MTYVLATTDSKVRWYKFQLSDKTKPGDFALIDELDLSLVPCFGDKETAKMAANAIGLKTWRYVRF